MLVPGSSAHLNQRRQHFNNAYMTALTWRQKSTEEKQVAHLRHPTKILPFYDIDLQFHYEPN